jgi:hypothetical protein
MLRGIVMVMRQHYNNRINTLGQELRGVRIYDSQIHQALNIIRQKFGKKYNNLTTWHLHVVLQGLKRNKKPEFALRDLTGPDNLNNPHAPQGKGAPRHRQTDHTGGRRINHRTYRAPPHTKTGTNRVQTNHSENQRTTGQRDTRGHRESYNHETYPHNQEINRTHTRPQPHWDNRKQPEPQHGHNKYPENRKPAKTAPTTQKTGNVRKENPKTGTTHKPQGTSWTHNTPTFCPRYHSLIQNGHLDKYKAIPTDSLSDTSGGHIDIVSKSEYHFLSNFALDNLD